MRQYLSRTRDIPFQKQHGKDVFTPRLKSGAISLRELAAPLPRRDFRPTFFCASSAFLRLFLSSAASGTESENPLAPILNWELLITD